MELETREEEVEQDSFRAIGAELAAARLERGMQIQELAQLLRISKHHLKNIETGDFDLLPGATYVSGYLRTYAREVGLDPVALPQRYRALLDDSEAKPAYSFPVDKQQPQRSGAMMASRSVVAASARPMRQAAKSAISGAVRRRQHQGQRRHRFHHRLRAGPRARQCG